MDELYKSTNVLKISDQVNLLNALFTHDALLKKLPTSFKNFVKKSVHLSNTRYTTIVHNEDTLQLDTLHLPHVKTIHSGQESVKYRSIHTHTFKIKNTILLNMQLLMNPDFQILFTTLIFFLLIFLRACLYGSELARFWTSKWS